MFEFFFPFFTQLFDRMAKEKDSETHRIDDILRYVGEFGLWQKFLYFSSCFLVIVPSAIQIASLVFATGTPKFHCVTPNVTCEESKCCDNCTTYAFEKSFTSTVTEVSFDRRVNLQFLQIDHWGKGREACSPPNRRTSFRRLKH